MGCALVHAKATSYTYTIAAIQLMILDRNYTMSTGSAAAAATAPSVADEERMHINDGHTENQTDDQKGPGESKGVSACVGAEDGDDAQLGGRTGAVLQEPG